MVEPIPAPSALLKADTATLTFRAEKDGSLRVLYGSWEDAQRRAASSTIGAPISGFTERDLMG
jgi:hypothetical protein